MPGAGWGASRRVSRTTRQTKTPHHNAEPQQRLHNKTIKPNGCLGQVDRRRLGVLIPKFAGPVRGQTISQEKTALLSDRITTASISQAFTGKAPMSSIAKWVPSYYVCVIHVGCFFFASAASRLEFSPSGKRPKENLGKPYPARHTVHFDKLKIGGRCLCRLFACA